MDIRKPDAKGRVVIGGDHDAYAVSKSDDGMVTLSPIVSPELKTYEFIPPIGVEVSSITTLAEYRPGRVSVTPELIGMLIDNYAETHEDHREGGLILELPTEGFAGFLEALGFRRVPNRDDRVTLNDETTWKAVEAARSTDDTVARRHI